MESKHDLVIVVIVGIIICFQLVLFYKNLNRILAFKSIISKNANIDLVELTIDEELASTLDPETVLKDMENLDMEESEAYQEDVEQIESLDETDDEDKVDELKLF